MSVIRPYASLEEWSESLTGACDRMTQAWRSRCLSGAHLAHWVCHVGLEPGPVHLAHPPPPPVWEEENLALAHRLPQRGCFVAGISCFFEAGKITDLTVLFCNRSGYGRKRCLEIWETHHRMTEREPQRAVPLCVCVCAGGWLTSQRLHRPQASVSHHQNKHPPPQKKPRSVASTHPYRAAITQ